MVTTRNWAICGPGKSCAAGGWGRLGGQEEGTSAQCPQTLFSTLLLLLLFSTVLLPVPTLLRPVLQTSATLEDQCYKWMGGGSEGLLRGHRWRNVIKPEESRCEHSPRKEKATTQFFHQERAIPHIFSQRFAFVFYLSENAFLAWNCREDILEQLFLAMFEVCSRLSRLSSSTNGFLVDP